MTSRELISPRAHRSPVTSSVSSLATLEGAVLGLFNNSRVNAEVLLDAVAQKVDDQVGLLEVVRMSKSSPSAPASEYSYDALAAQCDAVVLGTADCGACVAWGIHDAVQFEARGLPTACLTGDPFLPLAEAYAAALGYMTPLVVFQHPIMGQEEKLIREKADGLAGEVVGCLLA